MGRIRDSLYKLSFILYPKRCFFCNETVNIEDEACESCMEIPKESYVVVEPRCKSCGTNKAVCACKGKAMFYADIIAPYYYAEPVTRAVSLFKFHNKTEKAETFAADIAERLNELYPDRPFDAVCFVPQTVNEKNLRGYNQAELIADKLCEKTAYKKLDILVKISETPRQHSLDMSARSGNVMGVFDIAEGIDINGMNILLVDDIKTTGSTLNECAKMLSIYGANTVTAAVYAIALKTNGEGLMVKD